MAGTGCKPRKADSRICFLNLCAMPWSLAQSRCLWWESSTAIAPLLLPSAPAICSLLVNLPHWSPGLFPRMFVCLPLSTFKALLNCNFQRLCLMTLIRVIILHHFFSVIHSTCQQDTDIIYYFVYCLHLPPECNSMKTLFWIFIHVTGFE